MQTEQERMESRRRTLKKYRQSRKNYENQLRYRKKNMDRFCEYAKKSYWKDPEYARELSRKRYATPEGKAIRDASSRRYADNNRIKRLAKDAVHNAKMRGCLLEQPCKICGVAPTQAHHPDYSNPLEVVWLCVKHHKMLHGRFKTNSKRVKRTVQ